MTLTELETTVKKYMLLADDGVIRLICATIIGNKLPIPPLWVIIVGSSSGGKSMLLNSLNQVPGVVPLDDLTPNTFLSGMKGRNGKETSFLYQLPPNPVLNFKDMTTLMGKNDITRAEIVSQLRKIYDGDFSKRWGTGESIQWKGKLGLIAASTTKIYSVLNEFAAVGERFVLYHFIMPDRHEVTMRALQGDTDFEANKIMGDAFREYLAGIEIPKVLPEPSKELIREMAVLADLTTKSRSAIEREKFHHTKEMLMEHDPEMPVRFGKILKGLSMAFMIMHGTTELELADKRVLYRIAFDSIPRNRKLVMNQLTKYTEAKSEDLQIQLGLPESVINRELADLVVLKVVTKSRGISNKWVYQLKSEYRLLLNQYEQVDLGTTAAPNAEQVDVPLPEEPPGQVYTAEEAKQQLGMDIPF